MKYGTTMSDSATHGEDQEQVRRVKLERISALGRDPWGQRFDGHQPIHEVRALEPQVPPKDEAGHQPPGPPARIAGRVMLRRTAGKAIFLDLRDWTGRIQIFCGKSQVGDDHWALLQEMDLGDLLGIDGTLGYTKTGELTIFATQIEFLGKSILPPPEKWHGLTDVEQRYRNRSVDLFSNQESLAAFLSRSKIIGAVRNTLGGQGFIEVETPTMQAIAGGAAARPFVTHHNTLDLTLYMRIAPELYLKRLLVGGMERVFEIARVFRNEGISTKHNPEFTMMECYQAYGDYHSMMDLTEAIFTSAIQAVDGQFVRPLNGRSVDFTPPWSRRTYSDLFLEHVGCGIDDSDSVVSKAQAKGFDTVGVAHDVLVSNLFEEYVEDALEGPVFVTEYPASLCPLTKRKTSDPKVAERFELFVQGMELANAYTELNDPILQESLFRSQLAGQKAEDSMAKMDTEFIEALKHAMPPAGGLGIGIDRMVMVLLDKPSIRDVILFPLLRPRSEGVAASGTAEVETRPEPKSEFEGM